MIGPAGPEDPCKAGRDVHDASPIVESAVTVLRQQEDAFEVNADLCIEISFGHLVDIYCCEFAGIVDHGRATDRKLLAESMADP